MNIPKKFTGSSQQLHDDAIAATGLDDFGDDSYQEGLDVLLGAYDETAGLSEMGRLSCYAMMVNCLRARLITNQGAKTYGGIDNTAVSRPLFIVGLPRTGTTILQGLLAQDPANQGLEYWLGSFPQPRPPRSEWGENPNYQEVSAALDYVKQANPDMQAMHEMTADGADECRLLLMQSFANVTFQSGADIPRYEQWLYQADFTPVYQQYAKALKLIGSTSPEKRWILKDPSHLWAMDTLLEQFPDACIVQTHRDPARLVPSVSSLVHSARTMNQPDASHTVVGQQQLEQWAKVLESSMAVRQQYPERFTDVYFEEFMADPIAAVEGIYRKWGDELSPAAAKKMREYLAENPQDKHGSHHYTAQQFGLEEGQINARFARYKARFNV